MTNVPHTSSERSC